ncbi:dCMP deaminase [Pyrenophora tritici-repentis Pt-1C-BFP]|uniref:Deoxycytidylate deaminase n=1 Tax=Pyrenophora tritici-repentis (strain Pt-1C-BFP) TaxID=426418 RepID=B2VV52_PYRTR|nr:dCMP deaminase [Pyrenophora tritici-repentis Pt-1C-BFP]EDU41673.1 dCMP deaminase [Pyrenophora tritici-repentis Pt-1C-BFP]
MPMAGSSYLGPAPFVSCVQTGICAGKSSIASYLVEQHGFTRIHLAPTATTIPTTPPTGNPFPSAEELGVSPEHNFQNVDSLSAHVTLRWRERWVMTGVWDDAVVNQLLIRPFFLLVSVDAPLMVRWKRFQRVCAAKQLPEPDLEAFVLKNDEHLYAPNTGLCGLFQRAQLKLLNNSASLASLHEAIRAVNLLDDTRLRPDWDQYFMMIAGLAAMRCNCMKRRVGAVIVRDRRIISTGYNGTSRRNTNCNQGGCARCNSGTSGSLSACICLHAEENALLEAGRERIGEGATLYCNTCPCLTCATKITQVGITEVVYNQGYVVDDQSAATLARCGVTLRQFSPPAGGLVDLSIGIESERLQGMLGALGGLLSDDNLVRPLSN